VANERSLLDALAQRGFSAVDLDQLSITDQIRLFRNAECVVAPHGAGLSNLIFGRNLKVVELIHPHLVRSHFGRIARDWGFEYTAVMGHTFMNARVPTFTVEVSEVMRRLDA
jgi:capsular polysaccharide biosynthesis protein